MHSSHKFEQNILLNIAFYLYKYACICLLVCYSRSSIATNFDLQLNQAPIVPTLNLIAQQQQINLVLDNDIQGDISLNLQDISMDDLLMAVARIKNLQLTHHQQTYYLNLAIAEQISAEPILTKIIKLKYLKAEDAEKIIVANGGSLLSAVGKLTLDVNGNNLVVQDIPTSVNNIIKLIKTLDRANKQIMIKAKIVAIDDDAIKELGVRWGVLQGNLGVRANIEGDDNTTTAKQLLIDFPNQFTGGSVSFNIAKLSNKFLDLELSAIEKEQHAEIFASPQLLTTNKISASIKQGTEIPYVIIGKNGNETIEFREAVLGLTVIPQINNNNKILLDLQISHNSPGRIIDLGQHKMPTINKQEINTQVIANNGETIVLGGIFEIFNNTSKNRVPLLGRVPVVKNFFRNSSKNKHKRELLIFVTPYVLDE